jgi:hypothetical protein
VPNTEVVGTSAWIAENAQRYEGAVTYDLNNIHPYTFQTSNSSGNADWKSDTYYCWHKNGRGLYTGGMEYAEGGEGSLHTIGRMRSKFKWVRSYPNDNPPDVLVVKIIASVGAYSNSITSNDPNHPDRDVAKEHVMVEMSAEEYSATPAGKHDYYDGALDQWLSHDFAQMKRLMPVETNGQDIVWGPWVDIKAKADVDGGRITNPPDSSFQILSGIVWVEANYQAQPDNRSVKIVSPTIETSYYKSLTDPVTGLPAPAPLPNEPPVFYQAPNKRNADGSIEVDAGVDHGSSPNYWLFIGALKANIPNFQSPQCEWYYEDVTGEAHGFSLGGGAEDEILKPAYDENGGVMLNDRTLKLSYGVDDSHVRQAKSRITLNVTDTADSAVGSNTFLIRWHLPEEWESTPYRTYPPVWNSVEKVENGNYVSCDKNGFIDGKFRWNNFYQGVIAESGEAVWSVLSSVPDARWALFFNVIGVVWSNAVSEDTEMQTVGFNDAWDDPLNTTTGAGASWNIVPADNSPEEKAKYHFTNIRRTVQYQAKYYSGDSYDAHGYAGPTKKGIQVATGSRNVTGDFIRNTEGSGGGGGE